MTTKDEIAWLIEFPMNAHGAVYYGRTIEGLGQTKEHDDAIRFARKVDAEMIIEDIGWTEAKAIEHLWIAGSEQQRGTVLLGKAAHTPGPWKLCRHLESTEADAACPCGYRGGIFGPDETYMVCEMGSTVTQGEEGLQAPRYSRETELANARLIVEAPEMERALELLEVAELQWANCPDCREATSFPELCEMCFPLFDEARIARRNVLAKVSGQ